MSDSQIGGGMDLADAAYSKDDNTSKQPQPQTKQQEEDKRNSIPNRAITEEEYSALNYKVCAKMGKAVIVSNFMEVYNEITGYPPRKYAANDCKNLEAALKKLGFEPLTGHKSMVNKNLTKPQLVELYEKAAKEDYRKEDDESTCVLFIVMSYGRSGLITCHPEAGKSTPEIVEQKNMLEAFQPQNNPSLALKPKIFIVQTIPEPTSKQDSAAGEGKTTTGTRRIPREADFFTYTSDAYCMNGSTGKNDVDKQNHFVRSIVKVLNDLAKDKEDGQEAMEIQKLFIKMNNEYKTNTERGDWKIPCVTSSLTKQLKLF